MTVLTCGTFDLFHYGHVNLLREARAEGDKLIVGLNSDAFVTQYKGEKPIMDYYERRAVLLACEYVDEVIENDSESIRPLVQLILPTKIVVGSDWRDKDYFKQTCLSADYLDAKDISLVYVPYTKGISTTEIKKRCKQ